MVRPVKVKSITYIWKKPTYDISMSKNHNFFANNILTHNSHAEAYSILAWVWAYYKANYPLEFYCWMLSSLWQSTGKVEWTSKDKVYMLLLDYKQHGYKLLYPDINRSKETFIIDKDETWKEYIRVGFNYIKGLGSKQAKEIVSKQPFISYQDFLSRIDRRVVNSKILWMLKDMWLFNSIWWAPLISENEIKEVEPIDSLLELVSTLNQYLTDTINNWDNKQSSLNIYQLLWHSLDDSSDISITIKEIKSLLTKIKSKVRTIDKRISTNTGVYQNILSIESITSIITTIDNTIKEYEKVIKVLQKPINKRSEKDNDCILHFIESLSEVTNDQDLLHLSDYDYLELEKTFNEGFDNILIGLSIQRYIDQIEVKTNELLSIINLDTTPVSIIPQSDVILRLCPILLYIDLSSYSYVVKYLNKFTSLFTIDFSKELRGVTTIWAIFNLVILDDTWNLKKSRVKWSIMIGDKKWPLFINWSCYEKCKDTFDTITNGTPVVIKFSISPGFNMLQVHSIIPADEIGTYLRSFEQKSPLPTKPIYSDFLLYWNK